ncbi:MAG: Hpt domain-containing protein [Alphaproteobacteria bacterium]
MQQPAGIVDQDAIAAIRKLSADGDAMVNRVIDIFMSSSPALKNEMQTAMAEGDIMAASRHAHALKSACHNVGSMELPAMLGDIETLAKASDLGGMRAAAKEIERAFNDLTLALNTLSARG